MNLETEKWLTKTLARAIDEEDECELEVGLARNSPRASENSEIHVNYTEKEFAELEDELQTWRELIACIKKLQKLSGGDNTCK